MIANKAGFANRGQTAVFGGLRDEAAIDTRSTSFDCKTRVQPVDGSAGGALHSPVHRPGLRVQRVQSADDQAARHYAIDARRLEAHRSRLDLLDRDLLPR